MIVFNFLLKFIYSEKATKILRNLHLIFDCMYLCIKSKVNIWQNFVAFSEYMNFKYKGKKIAAYLGPKAKLGKYSRSMMST